MVCPNCVPDLKPPFSNALAKRNTSFGVLLVWLFALGSGVVNACLLEARGTHGRDATVGTSESAIASDLPAVHGGAVGSHDDPDASKAPCLKVCDGASQTVVKQPSTFDLIHPGLPLFVRVVWTAAAGEVAASRRMDDLLPSAPEPPIRIRYLRLAL